MTYFHGQMTLHIFYINPRDKSILIIWRGKGPFLKEMDLLPPFKNSPLWEGRQILSDQLFPLGMYPNLNFKILN